MNDLSRLMLDLPLQVLHPFGNLFHFEDIICPQFSVSNYAALQPSLFPTFLLAWSKLHTFSYHLPFASMKVSL